MNAKLCKKLRRVAERATVGAPDRAYVGIKGRGENRANIIAFGNHPKTTRGVYRALKRQVARTGG